MPNMLLYKKLSYCWQTVRRLQYGLYHKQSLVDL